MKPEYKAVGNIATLGLEVVLSMLFGTLAGSWIDGKVGTGPGLAIFGFLLGLAAAVKAIVRSWREMQEETKREESEQGNPAPLFDPPRDDAERGEGLADEEPHDVHPS